MKKCQKCSERAVIHITEIDGDGSCQEVHLCYHHAQEYLQDAEQVTKTPEAPTPIEAAVAAVGNVETDKQCPICKMNFEEFRGTGRLGCPHDYELFREELLPLLENIHGALRHAGKIPKHLPADKRRQSHLMQLRKELQQAIALEDYERAAALRDQIASAGREEGPAE